MWATMALGSISGGGWLGGKSQDTLMFFCTSPKTSITLKIFYSFPEQKLTSQQSLNDL
jgi:hypothetical protein